METIKAVGIGTPGPAKYSEGIIIHCANLPKFTNVPISKMLKEKLGKPVILENDANAACFGEFVAGAGKNIKNMVFFTLGTGIGGGIISDGKLLRGSGGNAAELGHTIVQYERQVMHLRPKRLRRGLRISVKYRKKGDRGDRSRRKIKS